MTDFLWEGVKEGKGSHPVRWEVVTRPPDIRGLGIGNIRAKNTYLLAKWIWQFYIKANTLWYKVIVSKYRPHPFDWSSKGLKGTSRNPWKAISSKFLLILVLFIMRLGMGGTLTLGREWLRKKLLYSLYPHLYHFPLLKIILFVRSSMVQTCCLIIPWVFIVL